MNKIKIIVDSTADLKIDLVEKYKIDVLPLTMHIGKESYKDGENLSLREMFQMIKSGSDFPTTSQVNPDAFYKSFKKAKEDGYENIICITLSSKLSGTYQSAKIAKEMLMAEGFEIENLALVDSELLSGPVYILILEMIKMIEEGENFDKIVKNIKNNIGKVKTLVYFDTLEHLVKGGRLPKSAGSIGKLLKIKPMITLKEGVLELVGKVRGKKRGFLQLKEFIDNAKIKEGTKILLINSISDDMEKKAIEYLKEKNLQYISVEVGCVLGVHGGPGLLGAFYLEK